MSRVALFFALLFSYTLFGQDLSIGATTKEEAYKLFGPPTTTMVMGQTSIASWSAFDGSKFNSTTLTFNSEGVLQAKQVIGELPKVVGTLEPKVLAEKPRDLDYTNSYLGPVTADFTSLAKANCKDMKKTQGSIFLGEQNFKGEAVKGFMSELLLGVRVKKAPVLLYISTPKMSFIDELYTKVATFEEFDEDKMVSHYSLETEFCISSDSTGANERFWSRTTRARTSISATSIKQVVIQIGDKIIKPRKENGYFYFPLNSLPLTGNFNIIAIDPVGQQAVLKLSVSDLKSKGVL